MVGTEATLDSDGGRRAVLGMVASALSFSLMGVCVKQVGGRIPAAETSAPSTAATPSLTPISRPPSHNPAPARLAHPALANTKPPDFVIATTDACRKVLNH